MDTFWANRRFASSSVFEGTDLRRAVKLLNRPRCLYLLLSIAFITILGVFIALKSYNIQIGSHQTAKSLKAADNFCGRYALGKDLVVDDLGYTCPWRSASWKGCCDQSESTTKRHNCGSCNHVTGCCAIYEHCVSCCLRDEHVESTSQSERIRQLAKADQEFKQLVEDPFELCQASCRTSSRNLDRIDGNFISDKEKHCYEPPSTPLSTVEEEMAKLELSNSNEETSVVESMLVRMTVLRGSASSLVNPTIVIIYGIIALVSALVVGIV